MVLDQFLITCSSNSQSRSPRSLQDHWSYAIFWGNHKRCPKRQSNCSVTSSSKESVRGTRDVVSSKSSQFKTFIRTHIDQHHIPQCSDVCYLNQWSFKNNLFTSRGRDQICLHPTLPTPGFVVDDGEYHYTQNNHMKNLIIELQTKVCKELSHRNQKEAYNAK